MGFEVELPVSGQLLLPSFLPLLTQQYGIRHYRDYPEPPVHPHPVVESSILVLPFNRESTSPSMPSAALEILPVDPDDYTRISDIETAAFATSPISSAIFSRVSPSDRRAFARKRFPHELQNPQVHLVKAVRDGEIVGFAQWEVPLRQGQEAFHPRREDGPGWPAGTVVEEANAFYPKLDLGIKEPHYRTSLLHFSPPFFLPPVSPLDLFQDSPPLLADLAILAVDPSFHRSGAGGALIRWGTEQADRDGLNVYLESSPGAVDVYPRFGFKPFREPIRGGTQSQLVVRIISSFGRKTLSNRFSLPTRRSTPSAALLSPPSNLKPLHLLLFRLNHSLSSPSLIRLLPPPAPPFPSSRRPRTTSRPSPSSNVELSPPPTSPVSSSAVSLKPTTSSSGPVE